MKISLSTLCFSLFILSFSCNDMSDPTQPQDTSENREAKDSVAEVPVHIPIDMKYEYDSLLADLLKITFEPRLFRNIEDAKAYFDEIGYTYSSSFSPEESITTLWVTMNTSDAKNTVELNYHYRDEDGDFVDFRNILSKIEDSNREKTAKALNELAAKKTYLKGQKYKKNYGEEGTVYYEEGTGQALQTIVSHIGGSTDWIEIRRCNYWFVQKSEILK